MTDEGQKRGDDSIQVITSDGLTVKLDATIFHSLQQAMVPKIYREIGLEVEALRAIGDKGDMIITPMGGAMPMIQVQGKR